MNYGYKIFFSNVIAFSFLISACGKSEVKPNGTIPACLNDKLVEWDVDFGCKTGKSVNQYSIKGKSYFILEPGNCGADMAAIVIDTNCNEIGYLGGIVGNNLKTNYGEEMANSVFVKTIWSN